MTEEDDNEVGGIPTEETGLDPDLMDPSNVEIEEELSADESGSQTSEAGISEAMETAETETTGPETVEDPEPTELGDSIGADTFDEVNDSVVSEGEETLENTYDKEIFDDIAEAIFGIRDLRDEPRYQFFTDIVDSNIDLSADLDTINEEFNEEYGEFLSTGYRPDEFIEQMLGSEDEEGVLEKVGVYQRGEGLTELGEDIHEMLDNIRGYVTSQLEGTYEAIKDDELLSNTDFSFPRNMLGPNSDLDRDQNLKRFIEEATEGALTDISKRPSSENNKLYELVLYGENEDSNYEIIAKESGRESVDSLRGRISELRTNGYLSGENTSTFGEVVISAVKEVYEKEKERRSGHDIDKFNLEKMPDTNEMYKQRAEELDQTIDELEEKDIETTSVEFNVPEIVKVYSEKAQY